MRNFIAVVVLSLLPFMAYAAESEGNIELKNGSLYRGQDLTFDELSLSGRLAITDLILDGFYVQGDFDLVQTETLETVAAKLNDTRRVIRIGDDLRSRVAFGFRGTLWGLVADLSVARFIDPVIQLEDYNEVSLELQTDWRLADHFDLYGHVAHAFDDAEQWHTGVGVVGRDLLVKGLHASAGVNFYHYERSLTLDDWTRNNFEVNASYRLFDTVDLFSTYSVGHRGWFGQELDNEFLVGVRISF